MKKIYVLGVLLAAGLMSFAQVSVTFQVDMSNETVSGDGVHIAGDFQAAAGYAGDWDPSTSELTDGDADGIYTLTVDLPSDSTYSYKYVNGNAWGSDEGVPGSCAVGGNRELTVPSSGPYNIPVNCYAKCGPCPSAIDTINLTLKVDMSMQTVSPNGVHVAGSFGVGGYPNWNPSGIQLADANSDNVYEITLKLPQGDYAFKFVNGDAWGSDESVPAACSQGGNREVSLKGDGDDVSNGGIDYTFIAAYEMCPPQDSIDFTLKVDMTNEEVSANGVHVAGGFGTGGYPNWDPAGIELTDDNSDNIYEVTVRMPEGDVPFKFVNGNAWGSDESIPTACKVGDNRGVTLEGNGDAFSNISTEVYEVCFGRCEAQCPAKLPAINVTFRVDMTNEIVNAGGVFVSGSFQNPAWDKDTLELKDNNGNEVYELTTKIVPGEYEWKFFNGPCGDDGCQETFDFNTGGCGSGTSFNNRLLNIEGLTSDTVLTAFVYNTCTASSVSIRNLGSSVFKLYPNPAQSEVNVRFGSSIGEVQINIIDINGRVVLSTSTTEQSTAVNVSHVKPGVYFVSLTDEAGNSSIERLVKQ
jgi:hypothetical protein